MLHTHNQSSALEQAAQRCVHAWHDMEVLLAKSRKHAEIETDAFVKELKAAASKPVKAARLLLCFIHEHIGKGNLSADRFKKAIMVLEAGIAEGKPTDQESFGIWAHIFSQVHVAFANFEAISEILWLCEHRCEKRSGGE